jgi:hypothetical protein
MDSAASTIDSSDSAEAEGTVAMGSLPDGHDHARLPGGRVSFGNASRLKANRDKRAVARPWERRFLGYRVTL